MKTTMVLIVVMLFCVNCHPQQESLALGVATEATLSKDLQLYPVTANRAFLLHHRAMSRYLTLAEAIDGKKVMVSERTSDELPPPPPPPPAQSRNRLTSTASPDDFTDDETPDVNSLFIENLSADTVLILGGEVVNGGNQDRTIATDVVLLPYSGKVDLSVFCVEQGRWNAETDLFMVAAESMSPPGVRQAATEKANQQEVWNAVQVTLAKKDVTSPTGTLMALKNDDDLQATVKRTAQLFEKLFDDDDNVIGIVVVSGGRVLGSDIFASPELFRKHYRNLLQSYITEATNSGGETTITRHEVEKYFNTTLMPKAREKGFLHEGKGGVVVPHCGTFYVSRDSA